MNSNIFYASSKCILLFLLLFSVFVSLSYAARSQCTLVSITGQGAINPETEVFEGQGVLTYQGKIINVTWVSIVLGLLSAEDNGTLHLVGSHDFQSIDKSDSIQFTTFEETTLVPTGELGKYDLISHLKIGNGHGRFHTGEMVVNLGLVDLIQGTVEVSAATGKFCGDLDGDDDDDDD